MFYIFKSGHLYHKLIESYEMAKLNHDLTLFFNAVMLDELLRLVKAEINFFLVICKYLFLVQYLVYLFHIIRINDRRSYIAVGVTELERSVVV